MSICFSASSAGKSNSRADWKHPIRVHVYPPYSTYSASNGTSAVCEYAWKKFLARQDGGICKSLSQCVQGNITVIDICQAKQFRSFSEAKQMIWIHLQFSNQLIISRGHRVYPPGLRAGQPGCSPRHPARCACAHRLARHGTEFERLGLCLTGERGVDQIHLAGNSGDFFWRGWGINWQSATMRPGSFSITTTREANWVASSMLCVTIKLPWWDRARVHSSSNSLRNDSAERTSKAEKGSVKAKAIQVQRPWHAAEIDLLPWWTFSALDVLSAESLRNELLELWTAGAIPTKAILMVTHNIEEATNWLRVWSWWKGAWTHRCRLCQLICLNRAKRNRRSLPARWIWSTPLAGQTQPESPRTRFHAGRAGGHMRTLSGCLGEQPGWPARSPGG